MSSPTSRPSKKALRTSLYLPLLITFIILITGIFLFQLVPESQFNNAFALLLGGGLLIFLIYWTRDVNWQLRLLAVLFAVPAMAGISVGIIQGRSRFIILGVGATFLLLVVQRAFSIPISYRFAVRQFEQGQYERALRLVNKTITSQPGFAESYQLRALIRTKYKQFAQAQKDAKYAIKLDPKLATHHSTLGQIFLAESDYRQALNSFQEAAVLDPDNPIFHFYSGLAAYRLEDYKLAAESFSMATKKTLPLIEYDILAHYFLSQALIETQRPTLAQTALETMKKFGDGLPHLEAMVSQQTDYDHIRRLKQDVEAIRSYF